MKTILSHAQTKRHKAWIKIIQISYNWLKETRENCSKAVAAVLYLANLNYISSLFSL